MIIYENLGFVELLIPYTKFIPTLLTNSIYNMFDRDFVKCL